MTSGWLSRLRQRGQIQEIVGTREPGGTTLGTEIRQILLHPVGQEPIHDRTELLLYAADRAQHVAGFLKPHLERGALILCDRYTDSTLAYQGYGRGLDLELIEQLNQVATGGLQSHLTLWLDLDAQIGLERTRQRGSHDRMEKADLEFHQRVQQGFNALAQKGGDRIVRVDANCSEDRVAEEIQTILEAQLQQWFGGEEVQGE